MLRARLVTVLFYWPLILLAILVGGGVPWPALAQLNFQISPAIQDITIAPGQVITGVTKISNPTDQPLTITISLEEITGVNQEGSVLLTNRDTSRNFQQLISWLTFLGPDVIELAPQTGYQFSYILQPPADAASAGYYASLLFTSRSTSSEGVIFEGSLGSLLLVTVPSDQLTPQLALNDFNYQADRFSGLLSNQGNIHSNVESQIVITNIFGKKLERLQLTDHTLLPNDLRLLRQEWSPGKNWPWRAQLTSQDILNRSQATANYYFWPDYLWLIVIAVIIFTIIILVLIISLKKKHGSRGAS